MALELVVASRQLYFERNYGLGTTVRSTLCTHDNLQAASPCIDAHTRMAHCDCLPPPKQSPTCRLACARARARLALARAALRIHAPGVCSLHGGPFCRQYSSSPQSVGAWRAQRSLGASCPAASVQEACTKMAACCPRPNAGRRPSRPSCLQTGRHRSPQRNGTFRWLDYCAYSAHPSGFV